MECIAATINSWPAAFAAVGCAFALAAGVVGVFWALSRM